MWTCSKCGEKLEDQFDSCWKCAGDPDLATTSPRTQKLTFSLTMSVIIASCLAPLLADCVHSLLVVDRGIRFYQAELGYIATSGFWEFLAGRTLLTLLVLITALKLDFNGRIPWLACAFCWLWLDAASEVVYK